MTLTELKYIVAVARERHFGRAAEACFVSQPTLSVAIKKLEDELAVQIFERGASEVSVTPVGEQIVTQAQRVLEQTMAIREIAKQGMDPLAGPLRLGVIYTIGPYLLPALVKQMIDTVPQMPLMLQENFTARLVELLKQGEIDCAIMAEPFPEAGLMTVPLYDEPFVVAVPRGHALADSQSVDPESLKQQTMLLLGNGHCFRDHVLNVCPELSRFSQNADGIQKTFEGRRWRRSATWWPVAWESPCCRAPRCPTCIRPPICSHTCRSRSPYRTAASCWPGARALRASPRSRRWPRRLRNAACPASGRCRPRRSSTDRYGSGRCVAPMVVIARA